MDIENNPYRPPEAPVGERMVPGEVVPAARSQRLVAAIVDGIIVMVIVAPMLYLFGFYDGITQGQQAGFIAQLGALVLTLVVWLVLNYRFLARNGQTIGKKLQNIRIVDLDGNVPDLAGLILRRYAVFQAMALVPVIGNFLILIDILFIFSRSKRCLHDHLAKTRVVNA